MSPPRLIGRGRGSRRGVAPLLGSPGLASYEGLVTTLVNELAAEPDELLLVLDDYHAIDTESVHESLSFLLEHAPPGLHVVLASRADPQFPLARLRARGQLAELRAADLRFTAEEAAVLLREAVGSHLHDDAIATLTVRTEGWAAGLQLAALSLQDQSDVAAFVATFSGSHRYVLDYLTEEVLERQPEPVRVFLLETSVLDRLSGPLCDAVTGSTDSQAMLETIEKANLFLVPLDEVRGWWRYHQLFADLLRARLHQRQPERALSYTATPPAGTTNMGSPTTLYATRLRPGMSCGRRGSSSDTPTHFSSAARRRRCSAGLRHCPRTWPTRGRGCSWPRPPSRSWKKTRICSMPPSGRSRPSLMNRTSPRSVGAASRLANVPAMIAARARLRRISTRRRRGSNVVRVAGADRSQRGRVDAGRPWPAPSWDRQSGSAAGSRRPRARLLRASNDGGRPARTTWSLCGASTLAGSSVRRVAWIGRWRRISTHWSSPRRPAGRPCLPQVLRTWAWRRWPTSGASSTPPPSTSARVSRCAASSSFPTAGDRLGDTGVDPARSRRRVGCPRRHG